MPRTSARGSEVRIEPQLIPPVIIIFGKNVNWSTFPPTYQKNRFIEDMVRHYACEPFERGKHGGFNHKGPFIHPRLIFDIFQGDLPPVSDEEFRKFHDKEYIRYLRNRESLADTNADAAPFKRERSEASQNSIFSQQSDAEQEHSLAEEMPYLLPIKEDRQFNLTGDSEPFVGMWRSIQNSVSGTLMAVRSLMSSDARRVAIHWFGGKHHAKRNAAAGFCFVNDVVLAAFEFRKKLPSSKNRLLIVDLDAHHGDGTQEAFFYDPFVTTVSMHAFGTGVFPGTGGLEEAGEGLGRGHNYNVPFPEGSPDAIAVPLTRQAIRAAIERVRAELGGIIVVCGSDALQGDPLGSLNLSIAGIQYIHRLLIETTIELDLKLLILGAGGYINASAARLAGVITRDVLSSMAVLREWEIKNNNKDSRNGFTDMASLYNFSALLTDLSIPVPDSCELFASYGPTFLMHGLPPYRISPIKGVPEGSPMFERINILMEKQKKSGSNRSRSRRSSKNASSDDDNDEDEDEDED